MAPELIDVHLFHKNRQIAKITTTADPKNPDDLEQLFRDMLKRDPKSDRREPIDYEIILYRQGSWQKVATYTGRGR